ncbi:MULTISPECIES: acyl-CoA dehydrogenase family protein [unclassified Minwuia]|uniref:acyl-CoA dehydrogenase family protein n=1 Tax=unclassified Minwuia TaxID=2618799 RepID=UPI00247A1AB9|nr:MULTISPECIES: acyl-CoA dehydrogenase family protein [unclassified Minwuia]
MDFGDSPEEAAFRAEARAWLAENRPMELEAGLRRFAARDRSNVHLPELDGVDALQASKDWQRRKYDAGWACVAWPREHGGRGASQIERVIWEQEEGIYARLSHVFFTGIGMAGSTIMAHGTDAQKAAYLHPMASGEHLWCQMFSEPSGGSDVAGLLTRAERQADGDWRLNGSKIWTTHAQIADYGLLIARTDPSVPKHKGLTMFILDMKSPGITVQPILQMSGRSTFNQVHFDDVPLPDSARIGPESQGWRVALTTLMNERLLLGSTPSTGVPELIDLCTRVSVGGRPAIEDSGVRASIARWVAQSTGLKYAMMRSISDLSNGRPIGPEYSVGKLVANELIQQVAQFAFDLQGPAGAMVEESEELSQFMAVLLDSPSLRVGGGASEIQRNIIGEQVLGLPQEPRPDKDTPFNETGARQSRQSAGPDRGGNDGG